MSPGSRGVDARRIDSALVRELLVEQFPDWADLPVRPVAVGGNDHRMFHLGDDLSVRLPSAAGYVPQVEKEQKWLPVLADAAPLPIPAVHGRGKPSDRFPAPWSVYGWLPGTPASQAQVDDEVRFAHDLAAFLVAVRSADTTEAPGPGAHSAYRGGPVSRWDDEMHDLVLRVAGRERDLAAGLWRDALGAETTGAAVWVHGDVAGGNLLVRDGRLAAVLDFGCSAVGDPACDVVPLWTMFGDDARGEFRRTLDLDDATEARGRGWALWKGLLMIANEPPGQAALGRHVLDVLFSGV